MSSLPPTPLWIQACICAGLGPELYSATISFDPFDSFFQNALILNSFYFLFFHFIVWYFTATYQLVLSLPWQCLILTLFPPELLTNPYFISLHTSPFTTTTVHRDNRPESYYDIKPTCNRDRFGFPSLLVLPLYHVLQFFGPLCEKKLIKGKKS